MKYVVTTVLATLVGFIALIPHAGATTPSTVVLFDGVSLDGWRGRDDLWSIEEGSIVGRTSEDDPIDANTFLVSDIPVAGDFELSFQYKIESGNSGVQYLSTVKDETRFIVGGYQADIDSTGRFTGILYEEKGRGILATRGQSVTISEEGKKAVETFSSADDLAQGIHDGQWNDYRIAVTGDRREHYINGALMSAVTDMQTKKAASKGVIALQLHRGPAMTVRFRNLILRK
ncbi:MAG: DUF1080 domain-containing protein [Planctomycetota bacterium]